VRLPLVARNNEIVIDNLFSPETKPLKTYSTKEDEKHYHRKAQLNPAAHHQTIL